jgi:hypothetical protein
MRSAKTSGTGRPTTSDRIRLLPRQSEHSLDSGNNAHPRDRLEKIVEQVWLAFLDHAPILGDCTATGN